MSIEGKNLHPRSIALIVATIAGLVFFYYCLPGFGPCRQLKN